MKKRRTKNKRKRSKKSRGTSLSRTGLSFLEKSSCNISHGYKSERKREREREVEENERIARVMTRKKIENVKRGLQSDKEERQRKSHTNQ